VCAVYIYDHKCSFHEHDFTRRMIKIENFFYQSSLPQIWNARHHWTSWILTRFEDFYIDFYNFIYTFNLIKVVEQSYGAHRLPSIESFHYSTDQQLSHNILDVPHGEEYGFPTSTPSISQPSHLIDIGSLDFGCHDSSKIDWFDNKLIFFWALDVKKNFSLQ